MSRSLRILENIKSAKVLADIHNKCFDVGWAESEFIRFLEASGILVFVAEERDVFCGMILVKTVLDEAEIITMGVLPDYCGKGIGTALLMRMIEVVKQRGAHKVFLEVLDKNIAAQGLYKKIGFMEVGVRENYYENKHDAHVLVLDLLV